MRYYFMRIYAIVLFIGFTQVLLGQTKEGMLKAVNEIRESGCRCGNQYMKAAAPLTWNDKLEKSARSYAKYLKRTGRFSHHSADGKDVGDRIDATGYNWMLIGENIAEGQQNLAEAIEDWIESPSHCTMIMNPEMTEMGLARIGNHWVQHFGKPMPKNRQ
jgi:uncharacterized protein YkwD